MILPHEQCMPMMLNSSNNGYKSWHTMIYYISETNGPRAIIILNQN